MRSPIVSDKLLSFDSARFLHQLVTVVPAMKLLLLFIIGMYSAHCALTDAEITQQWNDFKVRMTI